VKPVMIFVKLYSFEYYLTSPIFPSLKKKSDYMRKILIVFLPFLFSTGYSFGQNIGIGTDFPTANLEVRHPYLSLIKISTPSSFDTSRLLFSNRSGPYGTEMAISLIGERGLYIGSMSDLQGGQNDSILFISKYGNVGINREWPLARLDVNGNMRADALQINNYGLIELGYGLEKQFDNGRIGINVFGESNTLSIVGGGVKENGQDRRIKFWADSIADFTGRGYFAKNVGIGMAPTASMLTIQSPNSSLLLLRNSNSLNTGVSAAIGFGGNNYSTGIIQTIGNSSTNARMAFSTGYSFSGGVSNMVERLTISNTGNIGVNINAPTARLHIKGGNTEKWISISNAEKEVFKVDESGIKYDQGTLIKKGNTIVNSSNDGVGKWGYGTVGAEMIMTNGFNQSIPHAVSTKVNFTTVIFDHNNAEAFTDAALIIASPELDQFTISHKGIAIMDFELYWSESGGGFGGNVPRNGKIRVIKNTSLVKEFDVTSNKVQGTCYFACNEGDEITIRAYHEHCYDPQPVCITTLPRIITSARATLLNL